MTEAGAISDATLSAAERAIGLARSVPSGAGPVTELAQFGREQLEEARLQLVQRIFSRSDDYEATAALNLVNRALAALGWVGPYNWKHRRKP